MIFYFFIFLSVHSLSVDSQYIFTVEFSSVSDTVSGVNAVLQKDYWWKSTATFLGCFFMWSIVWEYMHLSL